MFVMYLIWVSGCDVCHVTDMGIWLLCLSCTRFRFLAVVSVMLLIWVLAVMKIVMLLILVSGCDVCHVTDMGIWL